MALPSNFEKIVFSFSPGELKRKPMISIKKITSLATWLMILINLVRIILLIPYCKGSYIKVKSLPDSYRSVGDKQICMDKDNHGFMDWNGLLVYRMITVLIINPKKSLLGFVENYSCKKTSLPTFALIWFPA